MWYSTCHFWGSPSMADDEIERLRSLLKNAHEQRQPPAGFRRLAELIANRLPPSGHGV